MAGEIGCDGLKVGGAEGDSVIRAEQFISQAVIFPDVISGTLIVPIVESVNIVVT